MLQIENLNYHYKKSTKKRNTGFGITNVNFTLEDGMLMCLLGRNGSGKTTLLNLLYGMIKSDVGAIKWQGKNIDSHNLHEFHLEAAYVGEEEWCIEWKSVEENIDIFRLLYHNFDRELFFKLITRLDVREDVMKKKYAELSTGQKIKIKLAFVMARRPKLVLLDEPFANLDIVVKTDLAELLSETVRQQDTSIIISTHLVDEISDMTDYIGVLSEGEWLEFGDRETVMEKYGSTDLKKLILEMGGNKRWT